MATKKPVAKKAAPKKSAPAKKAVKPAAKKAAPKKTVPPAKAVVSKKVAKPVAKAPAKAIPAKKTVKPLPTKAAPPNVAKKKIAEKEIPKKIIKPVPKKIEETKEVKAKPAAKAPAAKPEPIKEVKVPKTTVKTSVPYQPGYTSLEKRTDAPKGNEPLVRYSDSDLTDFRDLINKKLEAAKKELNYLQGLITRKDDMGSDDNDNRYMTMEDGSMSMEREQLSQMASRQITYIDHLEKAIIRIENKTYGICRVTGKLIDKARLRAVPHATLSLEAKLGIVKSNEQ